MIFSTFKLEKYKNYIKLCLSKSVFVLIYIFLDTGNFQKKKKFMCKKNEERVRDSRIYGIGLLIFKSGLLEILHDFIYL